MLDHKTEHRNEYAHAQHQLKHEDFLPGTRPDSTCNDENRKRAPPAESLPALGWICANGRFSTLDKGACEPNWVMQGPGRPRRRLNGDPHSYRQLSDKCDLR